MTGSIEGISVANIKSQKKRNIQNAKRAERNKAVRSELKTRIKVAVRSWSNGEDVDAAAKIAQQRLDKAAAKGIIHKNAASRYKSRLAGRVARKSAAA